MELEGEYEAARARIEDLLTISEQDKDASKQRERIVPLLGSTTGAREDFAAAIVRSGLNPLEGRSRATIEWAATLPAVGGWRRAELPLISPLGRDKRFLYPFMPTAPANEITNINDFRQSARGVTGTVQRNLDAVTTKAELTATVASVTEDLKQFAVILSDVPNQILESVEALADFIADEGRFQLGVALDTHVIAQIVAAAPPFGQTGADVVARIRNAISSMRANGAEPDLAVLNPTDAVSLDLFADAGGLKFPIRDTGESSPLFGLKVVEKSGSTPMYLLDSKMLGVLYMGDVRVDVDPYSGFHQNTSRIRVETNALMHVRQAQGAWRVAAT